ncbi:STAS-like domain-containing protein [Campylobacter ureolyticus]|nr:STAS-like domain-containing protein [Campylobacter ureolyticus]
MGNKGDIKMDEILNYNFAKEFTKTPGPRYKRLGDYSGEEFREVLKNLLKRYKKIEIDGTDIITSFNPSFLSEAFGRLAEEMGGSEKLFKRVKLFSRTNNKLEEKFRIYAEVN